MNPKGGEAPSFEAPSYGGVEQVSQDQETAHEAIATPESAPSTQPTAPPIDQQSVMIPDTAAPVIPIPTDDSSSVVVSQSPQHNSDKLDKHWLERTKNTIVETKDDPFKQKNEVSKIQAEYIEKRFNKKLKVDDAVV